MTWSDWDIPLVFPGPSWDPGMLGPLYSHSCSWYVDLRVVFQRGQLPVPRSHQTPDWIFFAKASHVIEPCRLVSLSLILSLFPSPTPPPHCSGKVWILRKCNSHTVLTTVISSDEKAGLRLRHPLAVDSRVQGGGPQRCKFWSSIKYAFNTYLICMWIVLKLWAVSTPAVG